ncbi:hypothetical protein CH305_01385 [Rhodococcus sp. 15-649-2-2]|nr:hypothetical protein CH305_01385 [Rhodococcus sp. 15-649-2-2]
MVNEPNVIYATWRTSNSAVDHAPHRAGLRQRYRHKGGNRWERFAADLFSAGFDWERGDEDRRCSIDFTLPDRIRAAGWDS